MRRINTIFLCLAVATSITACKKKEKEAANNAKAAATQQVNDTKAAAEKAANDKIAAAEAAAKANTVQIPTIELSGNPGSDMVSIFELGVNAIKQTDDPKAAASALDSIMKKYNASDLLQKAKDAKAAGKGISEDETKKVMGLMTQYKETAKKFGSDSPEFTTAHTAWSKAFGVN